MANPKADVRSPQPLNTARLPSVGVVVPTFNGGRFLRRCLDSVLAQDYPGLRCLVMDGGSNDDSLDILRSYGSAIEYVSEKDHGQADAIGKGFRRLDTDLVGWLNSDDEYAPGAVAQVARIAAQHPEAVLFHGDVERIDEEGRLIGMSRSCDTDYEKHRRGRGRTVQPGSFYRRQAVEDCGGVDASFHLLMDVDLWIRLLRRGPAVRMPGVLARFREHSAAKSSSDLAWHYYSETLKLGWLHERDRIVRATFRRSIYIAWTHVRWLPERAKRWSKALRRGSMPSARGSRS